MILKSSSKTVVTSFNQNGYRVYGKNFLESFRLHWPKDVKLVVYYEGADPQDDWNLIEEVEGLDDWMDAIKPFPLMSGNVGDGYDIQLDARMARKSFIQAHACNVFGGKVFWVDGDVFTFADVPETFLDEVLPDDKLCCYLGREGSSFPSYTESGFLGFNASHEAIQNFMGAYLTIFKTGIIFTMEGWHDCYAFDAARHITQKHYRDAFVNLAAHLKPNETSHPFVNSVLGKYMDHRKGNRKLNGSRKSDIIVPRDEDYWRGTAAR